MRYKLIDKCSPNGELWPIQLKRAQDPVQSLKISHPWCFNHFPLLLFNMRHLSRRENICLLGIPLWSYKGCKSGLRHGKLSKNIKTHTVAFLIYRPVVRIELGCTPQLHLTMLFLMDTYLIRKLRPYALDTYRITAETKILILNPKIKQANKQTNQEWRKKNKKDHEYVIRKKEADESCGLFCLLIQENEILHWDFIVSFMLLGATQFLSQNLNFLLCYVKRSEYKISRVFWGSVIFIFNLGRFWH